MEQAFERRPWLLPLSLAILTLIFLRPVIIPPETGSVLDGQDFRALEPLFLHLTGTRYADLNWL